MTYKKSYSVDTCFCLQRSVNGCLFSSSTQSMHITGSYSLCLAFYIMNYWFLTLKLDNEYRGGENGGNCSYNCAQGVLHLRRILVSLNTCLFIYSVHS